MTDILHIQDIDQAIKLGIPKRNLFSKDEIKLQTSKVNENYQKYEIYKNREQLIAKCYENWRNGNTLRRFCKNTYFRQDFNNWYKENQDAQGWGRLGNCMGKNEALTLRNYYRQLRDDYKNQYLAQQKILNNFLASNDDELKLDGKIAEVKGLKSEAKIITNDARQENFKTISLYLIIPILFAFGYLILKKIKK